MNQTKLKINPERKPPVPSDFWYNFDNKMFKIRKKKLWSHSRQAPQRVDKMLVAKTPVSFVYLSFGVATVKVNSRVADYWATVLGPRPKTIQVIKAMQDLQAREFKMLKPDIRYNFMVGGDGVVYEGRGWKNRPQLPKKYWYSNDQSLYIGFIGNWQKVPPPKHLIDLKNEVIKIGIQMKMIKMKHLQIVLPFTCDYKHELNKYIF
ncbi:peptidoglycan-recognition protein SB2-like [Macrosteles quadrilineatus]|uniref:peptidoglycan-recognition protein SB2-like n=1 Tax=Macrosteles quadrilineatus TaxID=74068 RepID=UPI0023E20A3D|nr:peptidoglycan-recognition protein SB2-like [Macrosteles quadrilineatus]